MMRRLLTSLAILCLCAACGAKGALEKPAGPASAPLLGQLSASQPDHVSTPPEPQK
ncbi:hypothetical protein [Azovibrio restrictus]|uniref:hypothetical protein n=1 Tax=Azovibrio restrictus TaxID=146938 RepID=UPI0026EA3553|nr:hypothetical protein [Azovibrio restrictus]MDD3482776.1 hypothetical protein [Azovibrio restrictus]